jgi:FkbM family methyltransferase
VSDRATLPRLLVIDLTARGDGSATGEVKKNLFSEWPEDQYLQVYSRDDGGFGLQRGSVKERLRGGQYRSRDLLSIIEAFRPELILCRPVPDSRALNRFTMQVVSSHPDVPLVTWIMDDWPARLKIEDPGQFTRLNEDLLYLLDRSALRLSICDQMSTVFEERYGCDFQPFANGVDPAVWPEPSPAAGRELVIRYAGALADHMTARSVKRVSEAVECLAREGHPIRLEIRTRDVWREVLEKDYANLKYTTFATELVSASEYREWLRTAGAVLIAYNFDEKSLRYIRLSMANKMPECLASGAPLIAHGPTATATIGYLKVQNCALILDQPDLEEVKAGLLALMDEDFRHELGARGRKTALERHDLGTIRTRLAKSLTDAAKPFAGNHAVLDCPRSLKASVDETRVVSQLLGGERGKEHVMLDVGAHIGTSASYFAELGWSIYCFEPDASNRAKLKERFGNASNVVIDPRAVGEVAEKGRAFFVSEESTGIGTLHAFRDTHHAASVVDVTTVADVAKQHELHHVDFLKIDVEGLDFAVLKGVPWDTIKPTVIECEFEDAKTLPLGHDYKDMADYLVEKGYTVYVSEWHPIVCYGAAHDWCRLIRYPSDLRTPDAWGNLLAFQQDPGLALVAAVFKDNLQSRDRQTPHLARVDPAATLVVLGNGPSLKGFDFERLRQFDCIGMNAAYRYWETIGWYPRFYACLDLVVGLSHKEAIAGLIRDSDENGIELFFLRRNLIDALPKDLRGSSKIIEFDKLLSGPLRGVAEERITTASHSAVIGALLGYGRIALLGIDCNSVEEVGGAKPASGAPGPNRELQSWRAVSPVLEGNWVTVWNCSSISRVDAFPFRDFDEVESEHRDRNEGARSLKVDVSALKSPRWHYWSRRLGPEIEARSALLYRVARFIVRLGWSLHRRVSNNRATFLKAQHRSFLDRAGDSD